jgi:hypothetical protein
MGTGTPLIGIAAAGAAAAAGPSGVGALNFTGASGSNFNNAGGLINMQADGGLITNAVTFNTTRLTGTSDLNYLYTFTGNTYNFNGGAGSLAAVDTFLGAPGSTSDRVVIGGNVTGRTVVQVYDTNAGPGALNLTGITVAAVQGTGSNNFVVDGATPHYANFGPLGSVEKGFFVYPLLYVPGGATTTSGPNGNAYKFFGLPGPFAFNVTVAPTTAQDIWEEIALGWQDRQDELRNCMERGFIAARQAWGSGADLPTPVLKAPVLPECSAGIWTKLIGSYTHRNGTADLSAQFNNPLFAGLTYDNTYHQGVVGTISGIDFGKSELTSPYDTLKFSLMGGFVASSVDFNSPNVLFGPPTFTNFNFQGGTAGLSATYINRGFFIDGLGKADYLKLVVGGIPGSFCTTGGTGVCAKELTAITYGALGNVGYRFQGWPLFHRAGWQRVVGVNAHHRSRPAGGGRHGEFRHQRYPQGRRWYPDWWRRDGRQGPLPRSVRARPGLGSGLGR